MRHRFLGGQVGRRVLQGRGLAEDEQSQCAVVVTRDATEHSSGLRVQEVDVLFARPISGRLERCHRATERDLEPLLRPERDLPDSRMQSVGADHEVQASRWRVGDSNVNAMPIAGQCIERVAEQDFRGRSRDQPPLKWSVPKYNLGMRTTACRRSDTSLMRS